jgi:transposase
MERYIGIDVHAESCTWSVLNAAGKEVRREVIETHGEALVGFVQLLGGRLHVCVEESEWAPWLHEILSPHVEELWVVRAQRRRGSKSDAIDARALAERLRTSQVGSRIFKAPRQFAKLRELARVYALLSRDVVRTKNRLKSLYRRRGISCLGTRVYHPDKRQELLAELPASARPAAELLGDEVDGLSELKQRAASALLAEARRYPISRVLRTLPGLGPIRVAQLIPIIVTPHRFRSKRQFWAYCGLGIVTRSSADWIQIDGQWVKARVAQTRGLNRNHNHTLKAIFKAAATTVICQKTTRFGHTYNRLCAQGTKPNLAKLTVARQLAATLLAMWKHQEVYDPNR